MTPQLIISLIETILLPLLIGLAYYLFHVFIQKLPEQKRNVLNQFVRYAVFGVEQLYVDKTGPDKKLLAKAFLVDAFNFLKLPVPTDAMLDMAIEATVKEMSLINGSNSTQSNSGSS